MKIISETVAEGVVCRRFDLAVENQVVPGMHWYPEDAVAVPATILMGHGGFQSKEAPNIVEMAFQFARAQGFATVALDAPGHGDRRTEEQVRQQADTLRRLRRGPSATRLDGQRRAPSAAGSGAGSDAAAADGGREPRMVREWKALLDELATQPGLGAGPFGYWGVSMGARFGIPLVATEPRISAAVFGLFGLLPDPTFRAQVESISAPLLFLFQHGDELMTPQAGLALWAAFGSKDKTMHINPGPHVGIPKFERDSSLAFFVRHLTP